MNTRRKKPAAVVRVPARKGHGRQRQRLIDACISALHLFGPSRTTVEKVVAIAKMSPGIVRFYFDSKAAMLVASLQFLAAEFEEQVLVPVERLKSRPVAALQLMVDLYLDPEIASPRKVSVWYAFWGEASSRQEYYDICGQKDESFAALVRELIERLIAETAQSQLDPDGVALGLIGVLEMLWQDIAFQTEGNIDRAIAKTRCMAYLRSVFPGQFRADDPRAADTAVLPARFAGAAYHDARIHALERERLFAGAWSAVGHETQIPRPGDFLAADIGAERALLVRDAAGRVHVLRNSCPASPHALVPDGDGHFAGHIGCALHGMQFSLDGRRQGSGLANLSVLESASLGGLVFARAPTRIAASDPMGIDSPAALPAAMAELPADLPAGMASLSTAKSRPVAADWKVVVELWLESAQPRSASVAGGALHWDFAVPDAAWSARCYRGCIEGTWPDSRRESMPPNRLSEWRPVWRRRFMLPNQLLEWRPDGLSVIQVLPESPGRSRVRRLDYSVLAPQRTPVRALDPTVRELELAADRRARAAIYLAGRLGPTRKRALEAAESIQQGLAHFGYGDVLAGAIPPAVTWFRQHLADSIPALAGAAKPSANSRA